MDFTGVLRIPESLPEGDGRVRAQDGRQGPEAGGRRSPDKQGAGVS